MSKPSRRGSVGGHARNPWYPVLIVAVIAVALSVILLLVVATNASNSDGKQPAAVITSPSARVTEPVASTKPGESATAPVKETEAPTKPNNGGDGDDFPVVTCGDILAPVDKQHRLAADCAPPDLVALPANISVQGAQSMRSEAADALEDMFAGARKDGFQLTVNSSYRSYAEQVSTYNYWVQTSGQEYADRTSARPGHSEHQMGTTADVGARGLVLEEMIGTPEADWIAENSWKYGFIVSYPDGKEDITGYAPEPWHVRYVGKSVASDVRASGLTLHEFLLR